VSIDAKFPVFGGSDTPIESEPEVPEAVSFAPPAASESTALPEPEKPAAPVPIAVIAGGSAALLIVIAVIIAVMMRKKKKAAALQPDSAIAAGHVGESYAEKTEFVGDVNSSEVQYTIKLSKQNDPSQTWTLMVSGDLIIGRAEHCHVRLDDKSVSREQCKITAQGTGLVIVHLGSTNKTLLNGSSVTESCPLQSGDMLKFGREVLRVNYIQTLGSPPPKPEQPRNPHSGKTESIF